MLKQILNAIQQRFLSIWFLILIVLIILPTSFTLETPLQFSITTFLFFGLGILFWVSDHRITVNRASVAVLLLGILALLKAPLVGGEEALGIMLPLAVFMGGRMEDKRGVLLGTFLGLLTSIRVFFIDFQGNHPGPIFFILTYIGCFVGARGYRVQSEAFKTNQLHLEELQKAHQELQLAHDEIQEAAVNTMQMAVLQERTRIAREMHDALGHSLTSLIVQLHALQYMLRGDPSHAEKAVKDMLGVAKQSLDEIRNSVHTLAIDSSSVGLTPLRAFLSQTANNTGLSIDFQADEDIHPGKEGIIALYRILQEAVTNTLRHSDATYMQVKMYVENGNLYLTIWDNGKITPQDSFEPGFGLKGMQERAKNFHGTLSYYVREPNGFQIELCVPYRMSDTKGVTK